MAKLNPALMASNLAFSRSLAFSPALLTAFNSGDPSKTFPVILQKTKNRGAFLNSYLDKSGNIDPEFDPSKPNVVEGDIAFLPPSCDAFRMDFSLNVTAGSIKPHSCELPLVEQIIGDITTAYANRGGFHELAARYIFRLLNGSVMWRNYTISSNKQVSLSYGYPDRDKRSITVSCRSLPKLRFPGLPAMLKINPAIGEFVNAFATALTTEADPLIIHVTATGIVGFGGEVYPSQVFNENGKGAKDRSVKELVSYDLGNGQRQGMINGPKIGNAVRHIDEWHGNGDEVIAIEAYGFVQHNLSVFRPVTGSNFYNLLWQRSPEFAEIIRGCKSSADIPGDIHYFIAMLIRGGVFAAPSGSSSSDGEPKKSKKSDRGAAA